MTTPTPQADIAGTIPPDSYVLKVLVADVVSYYEATASEMEPAWLVMRLGDSLDATLAAPIYRTTLDPDMGNSCTCPDGKEGRVCGHVDFLTVLVQAGKLPDLMNRKNKED